MKHIITIGALLAAGTALANAYSVTATTSTENTYSVYFGFALALGTDSKALTYSDDIIKSETGTVSLDWLQITGEYAPAPGVKVAVYSYAEDVTVGSFVGLSDSQDLYKGQETKFSFTDVSLTLKDTYLFLVVKNSATAENLNTVTPLDTYKTYAQYVGIVVTDKQYAGTLPAGWGMYTPSMLISGDDRMPVLTMSVSSSPSIPEPSAFGLLAGVGALALVAARRRRRKA